MAPSRLFRGSIATQILRFKLISKTKELNPDLTRGITCAYLKGIPADIPQRVHRLGSDFGEEVLGRHLGL
ncbi:uncharacterized protein BP5553_08447 [Venustampulla echinocandica]|uniref:Uncharacterized protein n=1 Tax=Venustampulla echinocandica TaxID=2656787 RepID=A0A370TE94_9HELO|nr:uncharacterized protein BP5553_08447 [Venustampulla echinocandica]RDL33008.1 hypothetical protein BP5553_08447 [Venustampulla echinocandica]